MGNMCSDPIALARYRTHNGPTGEAVSVRCPTCNRKTDCDSVLDVRMIDGIRHEWLCDTCRHRLIADRRNGWTRSKLARAAGKGWREVKDLRVKELLRERMQVNKRITPDTERTEIASSLPDNTVDIPGTEAPSSTGQAVAIDAPLRWSHNR